MPAYYTPPQPPRRSLSELGHLLLTQSFAAAQRWYRRTSRENLFAMAGLVAAHVLAVLLYLVMVDNMVQIESRRAADELQAQQRHSCAILPRRLDRDQCLISLAQARETSTAILASK